MSIFQPTRVVHICIAFLLKYIQQRKKKSFTCVPPVRCPSAAFSAQKSPLLSKVRSVSGWQVEHRQRPFLGIEGGKTKEQLNCALIFFCFCLTLTKHHINVKINSMFSLSCLSLARCTKDCKSCLELIGRKHTVRNALLFLLDR